MASQTYIALATAFGGIVLGFLWVSLVTTCEPIAKIRRVLKQVLFNQLDLWVEMKRADVETLVPMLLEKFH